MKDYSDVHRPIGDDPENALKQWVTYGGILVAIILFVRYVMIPGHNAKKWADRGAYTSETEMWETSCKRMLQEDLEQAASWEQFATIYLQAPQSSPTENWAYRELVDRSTSLGQFTELGELPTLKRQYAKEVVCKPMHGGFKSFWSKKMCAWDSTFTVQTGQRSGLIYKPKTCRLEWEYSEVHPLKICGSGKGCTTYLPDGHPADKNQTVPATSAYTFTIPELVRVEGYDDIQTPSGASMSIHVRYVPCD